MLPFTTIKPSFSAVNITAVKLHDNNSIQTHLTITGDDKQLLGGAIGDWFPNSPPDEINLTLGIRPPNLPRAIPGHADLDNLENFSAFNFGVHGGKVWRFEQNVAKELLLKGLNNISNTCEPAAIAITKLKEWVA